MVHKPGKMFQSQNASIDKRFSVVAAALAVCIILMFCLENLHAADDAETQTSEIVQTPAGFPYRRKREAKCPTLDKLYKKVAAADVLKGMKELNLDDKRYAGVCRMHFKVILTAPSIQPPLTSNAYCTCAFYARNAAVAAAHCFKVPIDTAKTGKFVATVVPTYRKGSDANNMARQMGVVDWWYPAAFKQPVNEDGKAIARDPASGHDIVFFRTDKEVDADAVYKFATPEQVREYYGKIGSVQAVGYPDIYDKGQVAIRIMGTLNPLDGDLANQVALQDEKIQSSMSEGASGGPWFLSDDTLEFGTATKDNDAEKKERRKWIIGINAWVAKLTPTTISPIISQEYVEIGRAVAEGKGEQHKSSGVYGKAADHKP